MYIYIYTYEFHTTHTINWPWHVWCTIYIYVQYLLHTTRAHIHEARMFAFWGRQNQPARRVRKLNMTLDLQSRQLLGGNALSVWLHSHGFYLNFCLLRIRFWRNEFQFYVQGPGWSWRYLSARNNVPKCVLTGSCWYFCACKSIFSLADMLPPPHSGGAQDFQISYVQQSFKPCWPWCTFKHAYALCHLSLGRNMPSTANPTGATTRWLKRQQPC